MIERVSKTYVKSLTLGTLHRTIPDTCSGGKRPRLSHAPLPPTAIHDRTISLNRPRSVLHASPLVPRPLAPFLPRTRPAGWNSEQPPENCSNLFQTFHPTTAGRVGRPGWNSEQSAETCSTMFHPPNSAPETKRPPSLAGRGPKSFQLPEPAQSRLTVSLFSAAWAAARRAIGTR